MTLASVNAALVTDIDSFGLFIPGSWTESTASAFARHAYFFLHVWIWNDDCGWWVASSNSIGNKILPQLFQEQPSLLRLIVCESRIVEFVNDKSVVCTDVDKVVKQGHGPATSLSLCRVSSQQFVKRINGSFRGIVV